MLRSGIAGAVQSALNRVGLRVSRVHRHSPGATPIGLLIERYRVGGILDVGANTGATGHRYRAMGYCGPIMSFEPCSRFLPELTRCAGQDALWSVLPYALGDADQELSINVTDGHGGATSFLEMTDLVRQVAPDQRLIGQEIVRTRRLDDVLDAVCPTGDRLLLKMDVQGFEGRVLAGAERSMLRIVGIQTEMSFRAAYHGEQPFHEAFARLKGLGYELCWIEPAWRNEATGEIFHVDGYFFDPRRL